MGITLNWDDPEHTILVFHYAKPWTWDEFEGVAKQLVTLLDEVKHDVYLVFDLRQAGYPPEGAMARFKQVTDLDHPNVANLIYVAPQPIAMFIGVINKTMSVIHRDNYKQPDFVFAPTLEQAREKIAEFAARSSRTKS